MEQPVSIKASAGTPRSNTMIAPVATPGGEAAIAQAVEDLALLKWKQESAKKEQIRNSGGKSEMSRPPLPGQGSGKRKRDSSGGDEGRTRGTSRNLSFTPIASGGKAGIASMTTRGASSNANANYSSSSSPSVPMFSLRSASPNSMNIASALSLLSGVNVNANSQSGKSSPFSSSISVKINVKREMTRSNSNSSSSDSTSSDSESFDGPSPTNSIGRKDSIDSSELERKDSIGSSSSENEGQGEGQWEHAKNMLVQGVGIISMPIPIE